MTARLRAVALGLCALVSVVGWAGVAAADQSALSSLGNPKADVVAPTFPPSTSFSAAQQWVENAVSIRQVALNTMAQKVAAAKDLTNDDQSALNLELSLDASGFEALASSVSSDATFGDLDADAASMVVDFHVFALVGPQVYDTITADDDAAQASALQGKESGVNAAITTAFQSAADYNAEESLYQDLRSKVSAVESEAPDVDANVNALTPEDIPSQQPVLDDAASELRHMKGELSDANSDLTNIVSLLSSGS